MDTPIARLAMVTLDCADPPASATFWSELLGWEVAHSQAEYAMLTGPDHALGFGQVEDYQPPAGPTPTAASSSTSTSPSTTWPRPRGRRWRSARPFPTTSRARPGGCCSTPAATRSA